ncbi:hypothetical protein FHS20_003818 [Phyllobacterium endophyticum]|uniref:Aminotransferase class I/classII domain-containing protein n=1 Tax=Phyllobacterium endophyticum TaxID=1149773 RepID=A0A2P7ASG5_9HYPH|nr:hypothetical protein [Phyllobacterium endophyticum]PSH57159.1 hypothetical protein CU100_18105 [Phyllobacterium endophyticum]
MIGFDEIAAAIHCGSALAKPLRRLRKENANTAGDPVDFPGRCCRDAIKHHFRNVSRQRVVADFLNEGYFPAHLRRLRERLRTSRDLLAGLLIERAGEHLTVMLPDQGINLTACSTGTWDSDTAVSAAALRKGVVVMPLSRMNVSSSDTTRLLLGFSGPSEEEADSGTRLLTETFNCGEFRKAPIKRQICDWHL